MPHTRRNRVRVFFINCPRLNWMACSYLTLAQNNVQDIFEFEIYSFWLYVKQTKGDPPGATTKLLSYLSGRSVPFRRWALRRYAARLDVAAAPFLASPLPLTGCTELIGDVLQAHDKWLEELPRHYGGWSIRSAPTIVVTETPFEGGYYAWSEGELAIISIASWERYCAPPSILEFILSRVQRYALRLVFRPELGSHYPTRACIWDFNANLEDTRDGVLVGYLCRDCEEALARQADASTIQTIKDLLKLEWIGRPEDLGSVASNVRRIFGYDLSRTKGLSRGFRDRLLEVTTSEVVKWVIPFVLTLLAGLTLLKQQFKR